MMSDIYIPKFLSENFEPDNPVIYELTEKYIAKFGHVFAIEGILISDEELEKALKGCLKTGKELDEYLGLGDVGEDDDI